MTAFARYLPRRQLLVKEYGAEQAPIMAAKRADALLDQGDIEGHTTWKSVLRAVQELSGSIGIQVSE